MSLVACKEVGQALIKWLDAASEKQRETLCDALGCDNGVSIEDLLAALQDCKGEPLTADTAIATCEDLVALYENSKTLTHGESGLEVKISEKEGNSLSAEDDGLYAPALHIAETATISVDDQTPGVARPSVNISKAAGNILTARSDGLAAFIEGPPEELTTVYIDSRDGDDLRGEGTKAAPFATINAALRLVHPYANNKPAVTFRLHAEGEYSLPLATFAMEDANLVFDTYGDPLFEGVSSNGGYYWWLSAEATRPKIHLPWLPLADDVSVQRKAIICGSVKFQAVHLIVDPLPEGRVQKFIGNRWFQPRRSGVVLNGCIVEQMQETNSVIFGMFGTPMTLHAVKLIQNTEAPRARNALATGCTSITRTLGNTTHPGDDERQPYTALDDNITTIPKKADSWMDDVTVDRTTKTMFGFTTSWDIFKQEP